MWQSQPVAAGKINFSTSFRAQELISFFQMWFIFKLYSFHSQPTHFSGQFIHWNYRSLCFPWWPNTEGYRGRLLSSWNTWQLPLLSHFAIYGELLLFLISDTLTVFSFRLLDPMGSSRSGSERFGFFLGPKRRHMQALQEQKTYYWVHKKGERESTPGATLEPGTTSVRPGLAPHCRWIGPCTSNRDQLAASVNQLLMGGSVTGALSQQKLGNQRHLREEPRTLRKKMEPDRSPQSQKFFFPSQWQTFESFPCLTLLPDNCVMAELQTLVSMEMINLPCE